MTRWFFAAIAAALLSLPAVGVQSRAVDSQRPFSVLFVGNSYTRFNVMPRLFRRLGTSRDEPVPVAVRSVAHGGYTLRMHWRRREAQRALKHSDFTHVILQDHSLRTLDREGEFEKYMTRFVRTAEAVGAKAVLYETWARHPGHRLYRKRPRIATPKQMSRHVATAYERVAHATGARVAPVGRAFLLGARRRPDIDLYLNDGTHPSLAGSFLAACVLYATVTGEDPSEVPYVPWELEAPRARALKEVAREALAKYGPTAGGEGRPATP